MSATDALEKFTGHVEQHRPGVDVPAYVLSEREGILNELLESSGLSAKEIQKALGINRTTWERWKRVRSVPNRTHLEHLRRIIDNEREVANGTTSMGSLLDSPIEFLSGSPQTYSQLRVAFLHAAYGWKDAVFYFNTPFSDPQTVVDMATLALNGCKIVYLLGNTLLSKDPDNAWIDEFVTIMVRCLGPKTSSLVLAKFCFLELADDSELEEIGEFGILNFWSPHVEKRVGYRWNGNASKSASDFSEKPNAYIPALAGDYKFDCLIGEGAYGPAVSAAFKAIDENTSFEVEQDVDPERGKFFKLPKINSKTNLREDITVYVPKK